MIALVAYLVVAALIGSAISAYVFARKEDRRDRYTLYSLRCDEPQVIDHGEKANDPLMRWRWIIWQEGAPREGKDALPLMLGSGATENDARLAARLWITEQQEHFDGVRMGLTGPLEMNR